MLFTLSFSFIDLNSIGGIIYLDSNIPESSKKIDEIFRRLCEEQKSVG